MGNGMLRVFLEIINRSGVLVEYELRVVEGAGVSLRRREGVGSYRVDGERCECPAWERDGGCKHQRALERLTRLLTEAGFGRGGEKNSEQIGTSA